MKKKSKYILSDGEEDDFEFQDGGYFPERDDYEDEPLDGDYDDADLLVGNNSKYLYLCFLFFYISFCEIH